MTSPHLPVFHASETHRFTPRRIACGLAVAALALGLLGCASDGLSARDQTGMDYPRYVMALSDLSSEADATSAAAAAPSSPRPQLAPPLRIAVAQFGEVAPPATLVDALRKDSTIFAAVEPIPGAMLDDSSMVGPVPAGVDPMYRQREVVRRAANQMRQTARDLGADYLFAFGGTCDRATTDTSLSLADLTIVGAFVVPSKNIQAEARAAGSLIDVRTGRIVLTVSSDAHDNKLAASVAQDNDELQLVKALRDKLVNDLAVRLKDRIRQQQITASAPPTPLNTSSNLASQ